MKSFQQLSTRIIAFTTIALIASCREDEPTPVDMTRNGDMETGGVTLPNSWFAVNGSNKYQTTWSSDVASSPTRSLKISTSVSDPTDFAYWAQHICTGIPVGKKVVLTAKVNGNLVGTGVSVALRADNNINSMGPSDYFVTTQGEIQITGTLDWTEYSVNIPQVDATTKCFYIFLVYLPNTTGDVYFDDVSLVYE